jgi:hypothetical protein
MPLQLIKRGWKRLKIHEIEWKMTEKERLAYIAKHPIKPLTKTKEKEDTFANIYDMRRKVKK